MKSEAAKPAGWSPHSLRFAQLPGALHQLCQGLEAQAGRRGMDDARREALQQLSAQLRALITLAPTRAPFEAAAQLCQRFQQDRTESYLTFLYTVLRDPLTAFASAQLRRLGSRDDAHTAAADLVSTLFAQMVEASLDGEPQDPRLPPAEGLTAWMFRALLNDVLDLVKSASNRLERTVEPLEDEDLDHALDRVSGGSRLPRGPLALEQDERQQAFLDAFERAMQGLKERHREVLRLREVENLGIEEIGQHLGLSGQQVVDLLQYSREKRAQLMAGRFRALPALDDLQDREAQVMGLLRRVRLWEVSLGLRAARGLRRDRTWASPVE